MVHAAAAILKLSFKNFSKDELMFSHVKSFKNLYK